MLIRILSGGNEKFPQWVKTTRKASKNVEKFCKSVRKAAVDGMMDTNGYWLWSDSAKLSGRKKKVRAAGGERKGKNHPWKQKGVDILLRPVAERHDCKKHEDAANADNEDDHHDHRVAVALFDYSHANIGQACRVQF